MGTGGGLGNQGGLIISPDRRWLFAVNAGSDNITSFEITGDGLRRVGVYPSFGMRPVSLAMHDNFLYVLNAGSDDVQGFVVVDGAPLPIVRGHVELSGDGVRAAQIEASTLGNLIIVTERATNNITTFRRGRDGALTDRMVIRAAGDTPFGFAAGPRDTFIISEASGGAAGASVASSYRIGDGLVLEPVSSRVATGQTAACWVVLAAGGRYAYTTNTGSNTITSFRVGFDGDLTRLEEVAATTGGSPIDMAVSADGAYLYVLNQASGTIGAYSIGDDGSLSQLESISGGLPPFANGLAAW
jgi:6-phosphogluconolactonase (cycloisomerase 2 family)